MKTVILSRDFKDQVKEGKRLFSDIILQYIDESDMDMSGVIIKNSKLFFVTFRNSNFKNAKFVNCEIIYGSFYGGNFENTTFDNCTIDMTLFQKIVIKSMKILRSKLIWSAILESATGEIDLSSSTQFKFFTDISQLTEKDLEDAMSHMGPLIDSLDISIRHKIKQELEKDAQNLGIKDLPKIPGGKPDEYSTSPLVYEMQNLGNTIIDAYNAANPYKGRKSVYEKEGTYKG